MEFLSSPLFVLLLLGAVAVAAVSFQPRQLAGAWQEIGGMYRNSGHPASVSFRDEPVELGMHGLASIDAALDDEGFWIVLAATSPQQSGERLLIPWDCIRFRKDAGDRQKFQIRGKGPIDFIVSASLGNALQRRADRFEEEDQL